MDIRTTKLDLIHRILDTENEQILLLIRQLLESATGHSDEMVSDNVWEQLTEEQQASIRIAIQQIDEDKGIPHASLMANLRQRFTR